MNRRRLVGWMVVALATSLGSAHAGQISLFNTGLDGSGNLLPGAATDPHYALYDATANTSLPALVLDVNPATHVWIANTATSQWISPAANGVPSSDVFIYTTTFSLAGLDPTTASISGLVAADDGTMVYLNGNLILDDTISVSNPTPWANFAAFSASSGFLAGTNTLEFLTPDTIGGPGGLQVADLVGSAVPEPSSLALAGIAALAGLGVWTRRRRG